jgi:ribokinase
MAKLVVVGSLNMDLVLRAPRIPAPGETILGSDFQMIPGGKGANQAYAAAQLGGQVSMIGKVGYDLFGDRLRANLAAVGIDVSQLRSTQSASTGAASITVDDRGQNSIVVASGANFSWNVQEAESLRPTFRGVRFALFQLETPLDFVEACLAIAKSEGVQTMLDPAPAQALPRSILELVDYLTPNESEAALLTNASSQYPQATANALHALGARQVVLKLGAKGAFFSDGASAHSSPAPKVEAIDSTAAGDTFNAALAVALSEAQPVESALRFANRAAALSVTRLGAQSSAPTRQEVDSLP